MQRLIKNGAIVEDDWQLLAKDVDSINELPSGNVIVPLELWLQNRSELQQRDAAIGVWLDSDQPPRLLEGDIEALDLIAINFPLFSDGRGYTYARELREHYNYKGEIRAIGDVLRDQLFYLDRCGFDAFLLRSDKDAALAVASFGDFSESYQADVNQPLPLFQRR
ncbi:MAG: DUF934 domain-containing protein [Pseudomonadales bacterium]